MVSLIGPVISARAMSASHAERQVCSHALLD
jgi:hypothetical protein